MLLLTHFIVYLFSINYSYCLDICNRLNKITIYKKKKKKSSDNT